MKSMAFLAAVCLTSCVHISSISSESETDLQKMLADGSNRFAGKLYGELAEEPGNIFLSPVSISTAFGLLYSGASGETAEEISSVLGYGGVEGAKFSVAMSGLHSALEMDEPDSKLRIANSAWVDDDVLLSPHYTKLIRDTMKSEIRAVDFSRPRVAQKAINEWALAYTNDRIDNLIAADAIDPDLTKLILVNTVWLKANWAKPFAASKTYTREFEGRDGQRIKADYMTSLRQIRYLDSRHYSAIELDYAENNFAATFILPHQPSDISKLEADVSRGRLPDFLSDLAETQPVLVDLKLPKVNTEATYNLAKPLNAIGLERVFTPSAELAGIFEGNHSFELNGVVHKTLLEIGETGTEAAAATSIAVGISGARLPPADTVFFHATHPYLVVLRHKPSGTILFLGRIEKPSPPRQPAK